jgi:hypothetical protein
VYHAVLEDSQLPAVNLGVCTAHVQLTVKVLATKNKEPLSTSLTIDDCAWHQRVRKSSRRLCMVTEVHFRARMRGWSYLGCTLYTQSCSLGNGRRYALPATNAHARHCHSHRPKAISLLHVLGNSQ